MGSSLAKEYSRYPRCRGSTTNWKASVWHPSLCLAGSHEVCSKVSVDLFEGKVDCDLLERRSVIEDIHLQSTVSRRLKEPTPWPPAESHDRQSSLEGIGERPCRRVPLPRTESCQRKLSEMSVSLNLYTANMRHVLPPLLHDFLRRRLSFLASRCRNPWRPQTFPGRSWAR
jgi:hypothetical protein